MSAWQKGCLCGCLIPEECQYAEPSWTHVVHHIIVHREPVPEVMPPFVDVEVIEVVEGSR